MTALVDAHMYVELHASLQYDYKFIRMRLASTCLMYVSLEMSYECLPLVDLPNNLFGYEGKSIVITLVETHVELHTPTPTTADICGSCRAASHD